MENNKLLAVSISLGRPRAYWENRRLDFWAPGDAIFTIWISPHAGTLDFRYGIE
jgi:hypothetical protein